MSKRPSLLWLIPALIAGETLAIGVFALFLQPLAGDPIRVGAVLAVLWVIFTYFAHRALTRVILPELNRRRAGARLAWLAACLLAAGVAILVVPLQPERIHFLFPQHTLRIALLQEQNPQSGGSLLQIVHWKDGESFLFSLAEFRTGPDWQIKDQMLQTSQFTAGSATWQGSLLHRGFLGLLTGPQAGVARITWDGVTQDVDLYTPSPTLKVIKLDGSGLPARPFAWLAYATYLVGLWFTFLALSLALVRLETPAAIPPDQKRSALPAIIGYALPMLLTWGLALAIFFPAVMSSDSTHIWRMIAGTDALTDWHPPIYTLLQWLLTRIWFSPAMTAGAQILCLGLVAGWGIRSLVEQGLPRWVAWGLSLLFALSPVNLSLVITIWKDIPYAISLLALFVMVFKAVTSQGDWLERPGSWVALGLVGASTSLFRHNGLVVTVVVLATLLLAYRSSWRGLARAAGAFLIAYSLISGAVYALAGVQHTSGVLRDTVYLHHIAAHVKAGTPLTDLQRDYLNQLRPLGEWEYSYCRIDPTFFVPEFDRSLFAASSDLNRGIFIDLALRDPRVEVEHTLGSSSPVWRVLRQCVFLDHFIKVNDGQVSWIEPNNLGIVESSLIPAAVLPLARILNGTNSEIGAPWLWGPALYFYLSVFCGAIFALRRRSWWILLVLLVPLTQSLVMALLSLAADFRYQYGVYLIALLSLGLLRLPGKKPAGDEVNK